MATAAALPLALLVNPVSGCYHANLLLAAALAWPELSARGRRLALAAVLLAALPLDLGCAAPKSPGEAAVLRFVRTGWGTLLMTPPMFGAALTLLALRNVRPNRDGAKTGFCVARQ